MSTPLEGLGEAMRILRRRRSLSQKALSVKSGVSVSNISACENGSSNPTTSTIDRLLDCLGADLRELDTVLRLVRQEPPEIADMDPSLFSRPEFQRALGGGEGNVLQELARLVAQELQDPTRKDDGQT